MSDDEGLMPAQYIDSPEMPFVQLKVKDLEAEHGERFIGVGDVAVDTGRVCWLLRDAPVFGSEFEDVAPIVLRRTQGAEYEVRMSGLPNESNFRLIASPDDLTWVRAKVI